MKYIKDSKKKVNATEKLNLPKNFEYKVFSELVRDLEYHLNEHSGITTELRETLNCDLKLAKQAIRKRDDVAICSLGTSLCTQSILNGRMVHCKGDAEAFFLQYQLGAFLKKYPFRGIDTKKPALIKFLAAEQQCSLFNKTNYKALLALDATYDPIYGDCIASMRTDIEKLLGAEPNYHRVEVCAKHGPGVTAGPKRDFGCTTSYYKWRDLPYSVTADCLPYAKRAIENDPRWIGALDHWYRHRSNNLYGPIDLTDFWSRIFVLVKGSRITTVPKSAIIDRTIAIEPLMNVYLQLGVDSIMKSCLKKAWSIDLLSQALNQTLANNGAIDGSYATIDLASASDTISLKICHLLLPPAWYNLLLDLRSPTGELQGIRGSFDKISSMGNGFTFALETIIFGAITRHVMRRNKDFRTIAVYGDDIVVPSERAHQIIDLLGLCGFTTNTEKTFVDGPFRESCGSDWFFGYNVRPVFLSRRITNVLDLFYVHNCLVQLEKRLCWHWDVRFEHTRRLIRKYIPKKYQYVYGPPSETLDGYLFSDRRIPGYAKDRWHLQLVARPITCNYKSDFYFRKLMAPLKGSSQACENRWDTNRRLTTGNSFDITRRDFVRYKCTKKKIYV